MIPLAFIPPACLKPMCDPGPPWFVIPAYGSVILAGLVFIAYALWKEYRG